LVTATFGNELKPLSSSPSNLIWEDINDLEIDRVAAKQRLTSRIFFLGLILVIITVFIRLYEGQFWGETQFTQSATLNVLIYFGIAFVLISLSQFALLRGRWILERTFIQSNLSHRWFIYAAWFLGIVVVLSVLLPKGNLVAILDTIRIIIIYASYLFGLIFYFMMSLFTILLSVVFSLFGWATPGISPSPPEPPFQQLDNFLVREPGSHWLEIALSIGFWISLVILVVISLVYFYRQNKDTITWFKKIPIVSWLLKLFRTIITMFGNFRRNLTGKVTNITLFKDKKKIAELPPRKFVHLRSLSAREKIIFYYLAFLRRGSERGYPRKSSQTPTDYAQHINMNQPDEIASQINTLTDSFLKAKYAQYPVEKSTLNSVEKTWAKLRKYFRQK
jgi:hypothetical protein